MDDLKILIIRNEKQQLDTMISTIHSYSEDIKMEFSTSKGGILIMQKRKFVHTEGFEFPSSEEIKEIDLDSGDKHLGILEADDTMNVKSQLNSRNVITSINS